MNGVLWIVQFSEITTFSRSHQFNSVYIIVNEDDRNLNFFSIIYVP